MTEKRNPAVEIAAEVKDGAREKIFQTSTGYWIKVSPVSATLIDKVQAKIVDPEPPLFYIAEKDKYEPNPNDPKYLKDLQRADVDRVMAALDAIIMLGVELCDEHGNFVDVPEGNWIKKLRLLEKHGYIDLSEHDLEDELDKEFLFKRYIALSAQDIEPVAAMSGIKEEDVKQAEDTFRDNS